MARFVVATGALFALSSCSSSGGNDDASGPPTDTIPGVQSLAFEDTGVVGLLPGEVRAFRLIASPPAIYKVDFALTGKPLNASLDKSSALTDENGVAEVMVTAPREATSFSVRALIDEVVAVANVSVSGNGFATIDVMPSYPGRRFITYWYATAHTGVSCSDLVGTPPPDNPQLYAQAARGGKPRLSQVPVGINTAITLRAGHYIGGCAEVNDLTANMVHEVTVPVVDRPIQLSQTNLALELSTPTDSKAMGDALRQHVEDAIGALLDSSSDDVDVLLDAMNEATTNSTSERSFATARETGGWDEVLRSLWGADAPTMIRDRVRSWMLAGTETLAGPNLFTGRIYSEGADEGEANFLVETVAGIDAKLAGFVTPTESSWTADRVDKVVLASTIRWRPVLLLARLTQAPAIAVVPEATSVPEALALDVDCTAVAEALSTASVTAPDSYNGCDAECTQWLCQSAMSALWQRVAAGPGPEATFALTLTGTMDVDDEARPEVFNNGNWVGTLTTSNVGISLAGTADARKAPSDE